MHKLASAVQVVGAVLMSAGVATFSVGAGLICAGACAVVFGVAAERGD